MIVDLLRNDLSRVCTPASVDVPALCGLESYAGLHHLVSVVTGDLREDRDALDLVAREFSRRLHHRRAQAPRDGDHRRA